MNVKQLKELLDKFEDSTKIMFSHTDPSDFTYKVVIKKRDVKMGSPVSDHEDLPDNLFNDDYDYIGPKVLLFNLNLDE